MSATQPLRILLIDDSANDALLLERAFQPEGALALAYHALDGDSGLAYLEAASTTRLPDLILLDLNMPGRDGFEVLEALKKAPRFAPIPVVIFTTSRRQEDVRRAYAAGAASFVTKPLTFEALCDLSRWFSTYWRQVAALPHP